MKALLKSSKAKCCNLETLLLKSFVAQEPSLMTGSLNADSVFCD
jgi:hypothetical protein